MDALTDQRAARSRASTAERRFEGVAQRVKIRAAGSGCVLRFLLGLEHGGHVAVEMRGDEIRGGIADGDRVSFLATRRGRSVRPRLLTNLTTGTEVEVSERTGRLRRLWSRIPAPIIVTVVGALLTAWLIPAITRQWQDQQRARDLKAALVARISRDSADALVNSQMLDYGRLGGRRLHPRVPPFSDQAFTNLDLNWRRNSDEIEGLLAVYFPKLVWPWRDYSALVTNTYFLLTPRIYLRTDTLKTLRAMRIGSNDQLRSLASPFTNRPAQHARQAYSFVAGEVLDAKRAITNQILDAHAAGYSQGAVDFLRDLLPFA